MTRTDEVLTHEKKPVDEYKPYRAGKVEWIYPHELSPPKGVKLNLLTLGFVATIGNWEDEAGFIAWQYLFKRNRKKEEEFFLWLEQQGRKVYK
jgi:hypothetical protein